MKTDILANRIVSGPVPAVYELEYEQAADGRWKITSGRPSWGGGEDLEHLQAELDRDGLSAFLAEKQHDTEPPAGGMYDIITFQRAHYDALPRLVGKACWVDPAVSNTDRSDSHAVQLDALGTDGKIYRLFSWERRASPEESLTIAINAAVDFGCGRVGIETDQGGDTWMSVWKIAVEDAANRTSDEDRAIAIRSLLYDSDKAGRTQQSKEERQQRVLADYQRGGIVHVIGTHDVLERALRRFPRAKPFDLADASYWSWKDLRERNHGKMKVSKAYEQQLAIVP